MFVYLSPLLRAQASLRPSSLPSRFPLFLSTYRCAYNMQPAAPKFQKLKVSRNYRKDRFKYKLGSGVCVQHFDKPVFLCAIVVVAYRFVSRRILRCVVFRIETRLKASRLVSLFKVANHVWLMFVISGPCVGQIF